MKDHRREDVVQLAEQIFAHRLAIMSYTLTDDKIKKVAVNCFTTAMIFREAEEEIFKEE